MRCYVDKLADLYEVQCQKMMTKMFEVLFAEMNPSAHDIKKTVDYMVEEGNILVIYKEKLEKLFTEEEMEIIYDYNTKMASKSKILQDAMETEVNSAFSSLDEDVVVNMLLGED